jgi:S1-C subfamily serine protease
LADFGPDNQAFIVPALAITNALSMASDSPAPRTPRPSPPRRGWLGVALQPITVPTNLFAKVGQKTGRMIVRITAGGPAERGGLLVGDVVLALNGTSASEPHALRGFLGADRIGSTVEVKLLRKGTFLTTQLVVESPPSDTQGPD